MLANLIIKIADVNDAEMIAALSVTTFLETFAKYNRKQDMDKYIAEDMSLSRLTEELLDKDNTFFLAIYDGVAVGYSKMRATKKPVELSDKNPMELERIYALKEYHDKKIGAALLGHCINHAISKRYDVIWLGVWEHNYRAVNFYKCWGFEFFGSHIFRLGDDDQTDVLMKKEL